jgi:uncharacterized membrane protein YbhN (UPF0104 family)
VNSSTSPAVGLDDDEHCRSIGGTAIATEPTRALGTQLRLGAGVLAVGAVVARVGTGPFVEGLRRTDPVALLAATAITALTTVCCAWRWRTVARALGLPLGRGSSVAAVFRSQFLNATLPAGIVGDVDRALGEGGGPISPRARSVVWERFLGQVVQIALTVLVVATLPSSLRTPGLVAAGVLALGVLLAGLVHRSRTGRVVQIIRIDLRRILGDPSARTTITLASAAAVTGHLAVFLLAARTAGVPLSWHALLPAAALVLLASGVPLNLAGWGPREGMAAWAFGATGLGAATGVTTAVVYGVMVLVATLPGAVVLVLGRRSWSRADTDSSVSVRLPVPEGSRCG